MEAEAVNMGVINIINKALNDAISRKEVVEKEIISTSVTIAKLETEPEVADIFRQRLRTLNAEKEELLVTIDRLQERAIKLTFNNYIYTDNKTEITTEEKVEEVYENDIELEKNIQKFNTPEEVEYEEIEYISSNENNTESDTLYTEYEEPIKKHYDETIEYIKPKEQKTQSSLSYQQSKNNNYKYEDYYEKEYDDYEEDEDIIDAKNVKIFYNSGGYQICFDLIKNGVVTPIKFRRTIKINLNNKRRVKAFSREHRVSYDYCKDLDINIYKILECKVDRVYGTDLAEKYFRNKLKARIVYNFNKINSNRKSNWSIKEKINQYLVALRQRKNGTATIYHSKKLIATLLLGTSLLVGSFTPQIRKNINDKLNTSRIEKTVNDENISANNSNSILDKAKEEIQSQKTTTESEKQILASIKEKENEIETLLPIITPNIGNENSVINSYGQAQEPTTTEEKTEATTEEKISDNLGIGIGDRIKLVYTSESGDVSKTYPLYMNAYCEGESILASKIECDYFKVSCIAVYKDGKTLDIIRINDENEEMRTNDIYKKYGSDVEISFNFDAYVDGNEMPKYLYIGWLNIDELAYFTDEQKENITTSKLEDEKSKKLILTQSKNRLF